MTSPEVLFSLVKSLGYHVELHGDRVWLRHDVEDCDDETEEQHDKVWREFCEIQEELHSHGYEIKDPEIEHDCISGDVVAIPLPGYIPMVIITADDIIEDLRRKAAL